MLIVTCIFLQIVGTATRETIPDVPMFSASPAKRPRRESLAETISAVGETIVSAFNWHQERGIQILLNRYSSSVNRNSHAHVHCH